MYERKLLGVRVQIFAYLFELCFIRYCVVLLLFIISTSLKKGNCSIKTKHFSDLFIQLTQNIDGSSLAAQVCPVLSIGQPIP